MNFLRFSGNYIEFVLLNPALFLRQEETFSLHKDIIDEAVEEYFKLFEQNISLIRLFPKNNSVDTFNSKIDKRKFKFAKHWL